jgi:glycosyltransferase involved in cell wall biosynthesis
MALVERFYPSLYETFIFVSGVTKEKVLARKKGRVNFCPVIPNGVNDELLHVPPGEGDYILFLSRIDTYTKGLDLLVRAFELISHEFPGIRLVLAGYEFNSFRDLIAAVTPSVRGKIVYSGFVTGEDKVRLLSGAKFFVLPSRHESAPISILEAAACGKPVLVSDIPELHFVREKGFGTGFRSGSADDLAEKMRVMLKNESLRQRLGEKGRECAKHFSWETVALQFEDALEQIIASAR